MCWPKSWPATPLLPAAKAQRNPWASCARKKGEAKNESTQTAQRRRTASILHDHSVTLSPMKTIYATGSLFSNPPTPPRTLLFASRSPHNHRNPSCLLCSASSFSPSFFNRLNQERCSPSIANWLWWWTFITWQLGVYTVEMWDRGSVLGRGMRGSSSGSSLWSHIDCHKGWLLCTSFTEKLLEN